MLTACVGRRAPPPWRRSIMAPVGVSPLPPGAEEARGSLLLAVGLGALAAILVVLQAWLLGTAIDAEAALAVLVEVGPIDRNGVFVSMAALNALEALGDKAGPAAEAIRKFPAQGDVPDARYNSYVPRLLESLTGVD